MLLHITYTPVKGSVGIFDEKKKMSLERRHDSDRVKEKRRGVALRLPLWHLLCFGALFFRVFQVHANGYTRGERHTDDGSRSQDFFNVHNKLLYRNVNAHMTTRHMSLNGIIIVITPHI